MAVTAERLRIEVEADTDPATRGLRNLEDQGSRIPGWAKAAGAALAGAFAVGAIVDWASKQVDSLARIEAINAQTTSAITATGGAANVTQKHVEDLAGSMEALTGTEAESVQMGANLLLTFKNIQNGVGEGNDIFDQSVVALTDMARAMGTEPQAAAVQLGKALNDPVAGISALSRVGITFSEEQKNVIKSLQETGDIAGAQKLILAELNSEFGGSGVAYAQTYAGAVTLLGHAWGTFGEQVMSVAMPALQAVVEGMTGLLDNTITPMVATLQAQTGAIVSLLQGEFTPAVREALGVEEDSALVGTFIGIGQAARDLQALVISAWAGMIASFSSGTAALATNPIAAVLSAVGAAARQFIDPVVAAFSGMGASIGPVIGQVLAIASAVSPLQIVLGALLPILPQIGGLLGTLVGTLVSAFLPVITALVPILTQVGTVLTGVLAQAFAALLPVITAMLPIVTLVAQVLGDILLQAVTLLAPIITMLADTFVSLMPALTPIIGAVIAVVSAIAPLISLVGDLVGALLPPLVELFVALLGPILAVIAPLVGALAPILTLVAQIITSLLVPIIGVLADWLTRLVGFLAPVIATIAGGLVGALSSFVTWVANAVAGVAAFATQAVARFSEFYNGAKQYVTMAIDIVTFIPRQIIGIFAGAGEWLVDSGRKIIQGLVDGIKAMASKVAEAVGGVMAKAREFLPFSPAKRGPFSGRGWTLFSGRSIGGALADGLWDTTRDVQRAALGVASAAAMNLPGAYIGAPNPSRAALGAQGGASGPSPADSLGVGSASGYGGPSTLVVVDADGNLIGRMRVEAGKVATGEVTPVDEGRAGW